MSDRKIITKEQYDDREDRCGPRFDELEPAPRPRQEIIDYIKAITHQPCSCTHCQTRKQILLWAFPGIEKELEK